MSDINLAAGEKIIEADHFVTVAEQTFAKVRADKSGSAGNQNSHKEYNAIEDTESTERRGENWVFRSSYSVFSVTNLFQVPFKQSQDPRVLVGPAFGADEAVVFGWVEHRFEILRFTETDKLFHELKRVLDMDIVVGHSV